MSKSSRKFLWIVFFVTPAFLIVTVVILLPLFMSLFNSLYNWKQLLKGDFVGFGNFAKIFTKYPYKERFFNAFSNNIKWFCTTMLIQNTIGLFFGYLLSRKIKGANVFKKIFFIPVLFSIVAVGFLWSMYLKSDGLVNLILKNVGLGHLRRAWLGDQNTATYSIIITNIWRWIGFPSLVFLAAIDNVDQSCLEAAHIDGCGEFKMFFKVIFPLIIPSITIIVVLTIIGSLNVFEQIYVMEDVSGAPNYSTDTISTLFYRTAFGSIDTGNPQIGIGSAIAVVIYVITFVVSLISVVIGKKQEVRL